MLMLSLGCLSFPNLISATSTTINLHFPSCLLTTSGESVSGLLHLVDKNFCGHTCLIFSCMEIRDEMLQSGRAGCSSAAEGFDVREDQRGAKTRLCRIAVGP